MPHTCQSITVAAASPQMGSSMSVEGQAQSFIAYPYGTLPDGACSVALHGGPLGVPTLMAEEGEPPPTFAETISIACGVGQQNAIFWEVPIGDVRDLPPGVQSLDTPGMLYGPDGTGGSSALCGLFGSVSLTIDQSVGGSAAFPEVVTPDYEKTMHLTIGSVTVKPTPKGDGSIPPERASLCNMVTDFTAALGFTNSAADIQGAVEGSCPVCAL
jgi:hypothetical protein